MSATVTGAVVFTDLVGFTEFNGAAGDEAALSAIDVQSQLVCEALTGTDGRVVKEIGDGLMLWFAAPAAAVAGTLALLRGVDAARDQRRFPLAMRAGAHFGPAIERGDDVVGQTVNIAARIADLAGPGELLVSDELIAACGERCPTTRPLGAATVKGVANPIWLHRVTA